MAEPPREVARFPWSELADQLADFGARWPGARADAAGRAFTGEPGAELRLPVAAPSAVGGEGIEAYGARLPAKLGRHCLLLLRAGSAALGYWDGDELVRHKALQRYVVRGSGKAQPTYLRQKGKSRYGSRLRLQNWKRLLAETNERLREWWAELGAPEKVFLGVPVRLFAELLAAEPPPPFRKDEPALCRIPLHVHEPRFPELLRVRRLLLQGRLLLPARE